MYNNDKTSTCNKGDAKMRKIIKTVCTTALCVVLLTGCSGSDPSDSVMELVKTGKVEQAQQIYAEKISGKEEYESSFVEKFIPYLENLIGSYNNGELPEEKINHEFETYKKCWAKMLHSKMRKSD